MSDRNPIYKDRSLPNFGLFPEIAKVLMAADTFVFGIFMYLNDLTYPLQFQIDWDLLKI